MKLYTCFSYANPAAPDTGLPAVNWVSHNAATPLSPSEIAILQRPGLSILNAEWFASDNQSISPEKIAQFIADARSGKDFASTLAVYGATPGGINWNPDSTLHYPATDAARKQFKAAGVFNAVDCIADDWYALNPVNAWHRQYRVLISKLEAWADIGRPVVLFLSFENQFTGKPIQPLDAADWSNVCDTIRLLREEGRIAAAVLFAGWDQAAAATGPGAIPWTADRQKYVDVAKGYLG